MIRHYCTLVVLVFCFVPRADAVYNPDSLRAIVNDPAAHDTVRFEAMHRLAWNVHMFNAPDSAMHYALRQLELAQARQDLRQQSRAYNNLAVSRHMKGLLSEALPYYELSLAADDSVATRNPNDLKAAKGVAVSHANIGVLYHQIGDMKRSIDAFMTAHKLYDALTARGLDTRAEVADVANSIGMANIELGEYDEAESWFMKSLTVIGDDASAQQKFASLNNLGRLFATIVSEHTDEALKISYSKKSEVNFKEALEIALSSGNKRNASVALNNLGSLLWIRIRSQQGQRSLTLEDFAEPLEALEQAAQLSREVQDMGNLAMALNNMAEIFLFTGRLDEAYELARQALAFADTSDELSKVQVVSGLSYRIAKEMGKSADALAFYERHIAARDSVGNENNRREVMRQQFQYDYDKREALLKADQEKQNALAAEKLRRKNLQRNASFGAFGLMMLLAVVFFSQRMRISKEKERSEHLLLNILPADTAEELKRKGSSEARLFDEVTVLFTDFKGFTQLSETLSPSELVAMINECFSAFDRITEHRGIEKIKTIGDAYMAAGGLPTSNKTHATDVVRAALDIQAFMNDFSQRRKTAGLPYFEIRIGLHTGPLIAGIVGIKKFQYDIWGDTVNTAARMESSGETGKVNISQTTFDAIGQKFACTYRGEIEAKGKGRLGMYFVEHEI